MSFTKVNAAGIGTTQPLTLSGVNLSGVVTASGLYVTGVSTFTGNVSIAGTLTYEDVTNVDSVGLITARSGIQITGGSGLDLTGSLGIITATTYKVGAAVTISSGGVEVVGVTTTQTLKVGTAGTTLNTTALGDVTTLGRFGVGTASPSSLLEVQAAAVPRLSIRNTTTTSFSQLLFSEVGDSSNFVINRLGSTSSAIGGARAAQIWQEANAPIVFATDNAEKIRIDGSGRLLVGTSSWTGLGNTPYAKLLVSGNTVGAAGDGRIGLVRGESSSAMSINDSIGQVHFSDQDGGEYAKIRVSADAAPGTSDYPGRIEFHTTADGVSSPTERMRITADGRVVIGNTSPENSWRFQVAGSSLCASLTSESSAASPMYGGVIVNRTSNANNDGTGIGFSLENSDGTRHEYAYIGGVIESNTAGSENGGIVFAPTLNGTRAEKIRIDETGRLLMGTTSNFSSSLGIQMYTGSPYFVGCRADNNPTSGTVLTGLYGFSQSGSTFAEAGFMRIEAGSNTSSGNHYGRIMFGTTRSGTSAQQVGQFDFYGNFYVGPGGDYSDINFAQTSGNGNFMYSRDTGSARGTIIASNNADRGWSLAYLNKFAYNSGDDGRLIAWYINGSSNATISWNGSAIVYGTTSDYRRKTNPSTYTGGLEKVKQLHVREFDWLEFPEADRTVGFFAHELQEIFPQAVTGVKDGMKLDEFTGEEVPDYQEVDYGKITPLLASALQEAIAKIETLEQRLNDAGIA